MVNKLFAAILTATLLMLTGCSKSLSNYIEDDQTPGLSIFSDKGFNILSCYVDGVRWRTVDRLQYLNSSEPPDIYYELTINKAAQSGSNDTLVFLWEGHFNDPYINRRYLKLTLSVKKDFNKKDFSALQGKRLVIDSTSNGYFSTDINGANMELKGNGAIYFHTAAFDSTGNMAGLFETNINGMKFTKGRFDEDLDMRNVHF